MKRVDSVQKQVLFKEVSHMLNPSENSTILQHHVFTQTEIECLCKFRLSLWEEQIQKITIIQRRLEFVRWLIMTKKLSDQVV